MLGTGNLRAGTVAGVGANVSRFKKGDQNQTVAAYELKGGFHHAEYAADRAGQQRRAVPARLTTEQAGVMAYARSTGLRDLNADIRQSANRAGG